LRPSSSTWSHFHLFLAPSGVPLPVLVLTLEVFLVHGYWSAFAGLLRVRISPDSGKVSAAGHVAAARPDLSTPQNSEG